MTETEVNRFRAALTARVTELERFTRNENAITFLERCEANSITLKNCPAYVRVWINGQRRES